MNTRRGELFIGASVTLATLVVIVGILFLGGSGLLAGGTTLWLATPDAAGAAVGDEVLYRGVVAGSVREVRFDGEGVLLRLNLKGAPSIPGDSAFVIRSTGVLGGRAIEIRPGTSASPLPGGARVKAQVEPGLLAAAGKGVEDAGRALQQTLSELNAVLRDLQDGKGSLGRAMQDGRLYEHLDETVLQAKRLLEDLQKNPKRYFTIRVF